MALIRGTALQGYPELVAELGGDPEGLLARARIPFASVGDCESFIKFRAVVDAIESAAAATRTVDFGRRLALKQGLEILGPVAAAARTAPTAGEAFRSLYRYLSMYSPAISASLDQADGHPLARFEYRILLDRLPSHPQVVELSLGVALQMTRLFLGQRYAPVSVHMPHTPLASEADYRRYFGCSVHFSETFSGFLVRSADMDRPLTSDATVHTVVKAYLDSLVPPPDGTVAGPAGALVRHLLPTGAVDRDLVAAQLHLHPRTLQRRLAVEGTTFSDLLDSVRRTEAERYLRDTDLPLGQLGALLGYSEQSVFTRACHRWFGVTGAKRRAALR